MKMECEKTNRRKKKREMIKKNKDEGIEMNIMYFEEEIFKPLHRESTENWKKTTRQNKNKKYQQLQNSK
jgi:hypothetical protein